MDFNVLSHQKLSLRLYLRVRQHTHFFVCTWWYPTSSGIILSPDPTPKEGKGLVHIERFFGLVSEYGHPNQIHAMWLACDYHVTPCYSNYCCTWEPLMHCHAKTMHCHDDYMTCCILCTLSVYQTISSIWGLGLGTRYFNYSPLITNFKLSSTTTSNLNVVFYLSIRWLCTLLPAIILDLPTPRRGCVNT